MVSPSLRVHGRGISIPLEYAATAFIWEHPQKKGPHSPCGVQYTKGLNNYTLIQK